jgi:hypothetical protein
MSTLAATMDAPPPGSSRAAAASRPWYHTCPTGPGTQRPSHSNLSCHVSTHLKLPYRGFLWYPPRRRRPHNETTGGGSSVFRLDVRALAGSDRASRSSTSRCHLLWAYRTINSASFGGTAGSRWRVAGDGGAGGPYQEYAAVRGVDDRAPHVHSPAGAPAAVPGAAPALLQALREQVANGPQRGTLHCGLPQRRG